MAEGSILNDTKKMLGIDESYSAFDLDIKLHINSVLSKLDQLGIGPAGGLAISDASATWVDLIGDDARLNQVQTYVYLNVRMGFDPPNTSFVLNAQKELIQEQECRLLMVVENDRWDAARARG